MLKMKIYLEDCVNITTFAVGKTVNLHHVTSQMCNLLKITELC